MAKLMTRILSMYYMVSVNAGSTVEAVLTPTDYDHDGIAVSFGDQCDVSATEWYLNSERTYDLESWAIEVALSSPFGVSSGVGTLSFELNGTIKTSQADMIFGFGDGNKYIAFIADFDGGVSSNGVDAGLSIYPACAASGGSLGSGAVSDLMVDSSQYTGDPWYQPRYALAGGSLDNWELFGGSSVHNGHTWPVTMEITNDVDANEVTFRWSSATVSRECVYSDAFAAGDFVYAIMPDPDSGTSDDFYLHSITVTTTDTGNGATENPTEQPTEVPTPPTEEPSFEPTVFPTVQPTSPSEVPTAQPSTSPTISCPEEDRNVVIWHNLLNEDDSTTLLHESDITFDASSLSLTFTASLEYVGLSADGNFDDDYNLGTTYWIDFNSFAESDGGVNEAGTCGNRNSEDYDNLDFANWWEYTVNPQNLANAANAERMAYPDSNWTLNAASGSCAVIGYERTFSWTQLAECNDFGDNGLIQVTQTADAITLSGTFFVELVSPYSMSVADYYRTYPLLQQEFAIVLNREVNALASTGVQLFISTVMAYGRDDDGNYELTILVQSADYVQLGIGNDVTLIAGPWDPSDIQTVTGDDCLVASSFTCAQIFTATIPADCSADENIVDLSGTYQFAFEPDCQTLDGGSEDVACTTFLTTLDETSGNVVLDVDSSFIDNCDVDLFNVTFGADLTFYEDDAFTVAVGDYSDPYVIGQDTIYGKVLVDIAVDEDAEMYTFVNVSIENIYVCTAEDELSLDSDSGIGGCLSSDIDADGPYVVYGSGAETKYLGETYPATGNEATFSFLTFDTPRTTINVHVQLLLTLTTDSGRRRRMLLETGSEEGNAFQSFIGTASVQEGETTAEPVGTDGAAKLSASFIAAMFAFTAYILG